MKINYAHQNPPRNSSFKRGTLAINLPTKQDLLNLLTVHGTALAVKAGAARVHPKENFIKKVGRETAEKRMDIFPAYLKEVESRGTTLVYNMQLALKCSCPNQTIQFIDVGFSTTAETNHVKLLYAYFI